MSELKYFMSYICHEHLSPKEIINIPLLDVTLLQLSLSVLAVQYIETTSLRNMEERFNYLKYTFSLECMLGTSVVSYEAISDSPERRWFQYAWTGFLILLQFINTGHDLYECFMPMNHVLLFVPTVSRFVQDIFMLYLLTRSLKKNSQVTAGLHLDALEDYLRGLNIDLPGARLEQSVVVMLLMMCIVHVADLVTGLVFLVSHDKRESNLRIFYIIVIMVYSNAVTCSQMFGCVLLLTRCLRTQLALNKQLEGLGLRCEEETLPTVSVIHRREAWVEGTETSQSVLTAIKTVHNVLASTEREVKSSYWVLVALIAFVSSVNTPVLTLLCIHESNLFLWGPVAILAVCLVLCLAVTVIHSLHQSSKQAMEAELAKLLRNSDEEHRRSIRHQLRALKGSENFDCYLVDVDYSLMATILETTMLIVCTVLSYSF